MALFFRCAASQGGPFYCKREGRPKKGRFFRFFTAAAICGAHIGSMTAVGVSVPVFRPLQTCGEGARANGPESAAGVHAKAAPTRGMPAAPSRALCLVRLRGGQLEVEPAAAAWLAGLRQPVAVVCSAAARSKCPDAQRLTRPPFTLEPQPLAKGRSLAPSGAPSPLGCRKVPALEFHRL